MSIATVDISHQKLFQSLSTAYIVFGVDDPTFTVLEENHAHAKLAMVARKDIIGKPLIEAFPDTSDDYMKHGKSRLLESIRKVISTGKPDEMRDLQYDLKDKKGTLQTMYWSVSHHPIVEKGVVTAVFQVTEDITRQVRAEQTQSSTKSQLNQILEYGNIGTWLWDVKDEKVSGDKNMAKFFGYDDDKVASGLSVQEYVKAIHPDDQKRVADEFARALKLAQPYESEYRTIDNHGNLRWVLARGYVEVNDKNKVVRSPGVVIDITDRKRAEDGIRFLTKATAQFSASLDYRKTLKNIAKLVVPNLADWCTVHLYEDNIIEQVVVLHKDPKKIKWAQELQDVQGPPDMSQTTGLPKVLKTGEVEFYAEITDEMLRMGSKNEQHFKLLKSVGFTSVIIVPMTIDKKVIGALTFIASESRVHYKQSDIELARAFANRAALAVYNARLYTDAQHEIISRIRLQRDLEILNNQLEYRVEERTKQLLQTNKGLEAEIIKRQEAERVLEEYSKELARSNQELQDFAYVASHDLQEPLRKIQAFGDLLEAEYSKALGENGQQYLTRMRSAASRMSTLIEDLLAFSRVTTKAQPYVAVDLNTIASDVIEDLGLRIATTRGAVNVAPLPTVWADPTHMRQLLQNLIGNGLKFHRKDAPPVVKVYVQATKSTDENYTICIEDNGIGFEEKYLDRIFSVFQRLHGKDEYEGTGIGLAVCRKIAERYGGTITATSKKGIGSTFLFTIPMTNKEPAND
jgi:PAS domain S-box-containing protein